MGAFGVIAVTGGSHNCHRAVAVVLIAPSWAKPFDAMPSTSGTKGSKHSKAYHARRRRLTKADASAMNAKRNVAIAVRQLTAAVRTLIHVQAGSSKEARSAKVVRAAAKDLVTARKKLRRAVKKRKKALARLSTPSTRLRQGKRARRRATPRRQQR